MSQQVALCTVAIAVLLSACSTGRLPRTANGRPHPRIAAAIAACSTDRPLPEHARDRTGQEPELVPIEFELPFPGAHDHSRLWAAYRAKPSMHMEPLLPAGKRHAPVLAPRDTKNVALKRAVTSSDKNPLIGELAQVTDGVKRLVESSYVELASGPQWVQIDLQGMYRIYAVLFWHWHTVPRYYHDVVVQVADDADFMTNVRTVFNNDYDNSLGRGVGAQLEYPETHEGKLVACKGMAARYVRLYSRGSDVNDLNHYIEVEVYGTPAK